MPDAFTTRLARPVWPARFVCVAPRPTRRLLLVLALLHAPGLQSAGVVAQDAAVCTDCITLEHVLTLGGLDGEGVETISPYSTVALDTSGRFLVATVPSPSAFVAAFDSTGRFVRRVGRQGRGPGEYEMVVHLSAGHGFVHVFDIANGHTLLDRNLDFVRTRVVRGQVRSSVPLPDGRILFSAALSDPMSDGEPLHLLSERGDLVSFGRDAGVPRGRPDVLFLGADSASVWTVAERAYRVIRWDVERRSRTRVHDVSARWFEDDRTEAFPRSLLLGIASDPADPLLWIVGRSPDERWTERWYPGRDPSRPVPSDRRAVWDGVLDVLDPVSGERVAHLRSDDEFLGVVPGTALILRYREDEIGVPYVDLLRPRYTPGSHRD